MTSELPVDRRDTASRWNYLWIVLGLLGGLAGNAFVKDRDPQLGRRLLIGGAIATVMGPILALAALLASTALFVGGDDNLGEKAPVAAGNVPGDETGSGVRILLEMQNAEGVRADADSIDRTLNVLRQRLRAAGIAEPRVAPQGDTRIIVEVVGVTDATAVERWVARTGRLTFHPVLGPGDSAEVSGIQPEQAPPPSFATNGRVLPEALTLDSPRMQSQPDEIDTSRPNTLVDETGIPIQIGPAALTGEEVGDAAAAVDPQTGTQRFVSLDFQGEGGRKWEALTGAAACNPPGDLTRRVAIVLDGQVISSPQVAEDVQCNVGIQSGSTQITGNFTQEDAEQLAILIKTGALPVPVVIISRSTFER